MAYSVIFGLVLTASLSQVALVRYGGDAGGSKGGTGGYGDVYETPPQAGEEYDSACLGERQSPILIDTAQVKKSPGLGLLEFQAYGAKPKNSTWSIVNNGYTVKFSGNFEQQPTVRKGGLPDDYVFAQFHFHWGNMSKRGAEHVIDRKHHPLELHIVHRKINVTAAQMLKDSTGLAVLSVLFELTTDNDRVHKHMNSIVDALHKVTRPNQAVNIKLDHLTLEQLIPATGGFYRYLGSLTTPPCAEAVKWTVFDKSQFITERQLEAFRSLDLANGLGADIEKNFRPLQDLNGRVIQHYTK